MDMGKRIVYYVLAGMMAWCSWYGGSVKAEEATQSESGLGDDLSPIREEFLQQIEDVRDTLLEETDDMPYPEDQAMKQLQQLETRIDESLDLLERYRQRLNNYFILVALASLMLLVVPLIYLGKYIYRLGRTAVHLDELLRENSTIQRTTEAAGGSKDIPQK